MSVKYPKAELAQAGAMTSIDEKTPDLIDVGGTDCVPVTISGITTVTNEGITALAIINAGGSVEATQGEGDSYDVNVGNWPANPATSTLQGNTNTKLDSIITKLNGGLPPALIGGLLGVVESNSELIRIEISQANAKLPSALVSDRLKVDPSGVTSPVSVVSLPLPSGAATGTKQDAGNTSLANVEAYLIPSNASPVNFTVSATTAPTALANHAGRRVLIVSETANTAAVRVGGSSTSTTVGTPIYPTGSREYVTTNSNLIYVCAVSGTQTLNVEVIS